MKTDVVDRILKQWQTTRPDLNSGSLGIVGRILRLAGHLERRANEALREFDLPIWGFDVLGALHRSGSPYTLTPTLLMKAMMLSSGAMTNRLDRLEAIGLLKRIPDPSDRRSLQVQLTDRGLTVVIQAEVSRFREAADAVNGLTAAEQEQLGRLLRKLMLHLDAD